MASDLDYCSELAKQAYASLLKMASGNTIRTKTVMDGLGARLGAGQVEVREAVRELYRSKLLRYVPDAQDLPAAGLITIERPEKHVSVHEQVWYKALAASRLNDTAREALRPLHPKLIDLSSEDMTVLVDSFEQLASSSSAALADAGFNVSARSIMGGSKVLANLAPKMLQGLGLPARLQTSSPRYVLCAGPAQPEATLLIENPRAFENAVRSGLGETVALVCTYGFGLSYLGQAWGPEAHEEDRPIQIVRSGAPPPLLTLLQAEKVFLWADLDLAALSIFRSLQSAIPHLQFSRIYEPMMMMAQDHSQSHPYAVVFEKDGQPLNSAGAFHALDPATRAILESCKTRAVDQEAVSEEHIMLFGRVPLGLVNTDNAQ